MPPRISEQANVDCRVNWFNLLMRSLYVFRSAYVKITLLFARPPLIGSPRSFTHHVTAAFITLWKLLCSSFIWQVCSIWRIEVFYGCDWAKSHDNDNQVNFWASRPQLFFRNRIWRIISFISNLNTRFRLYILSYEFKYKALISKAVPTRYTVWLEFLETRPSFGAPGSSSRTSLGFATTAKQTTRWIRTFGLGEVKQISQSRLRCISGGCGVTSGPRRVLRCDNVASHSLPHCAAHTAATIAHTPDVMFVGPVIV